jgi:hypothetical protein
MSAIRASMKPSRSNTRRAPDTRALRVRVPRAAGGLREVVVDDSTERTIVEIESEFKVR